MPSSDFDALVHAAAVCLPATLSWRHSAYNASSVWKVCMFDVMNEFLPLGQSMLHPLLTQVEHGTIWERSVRCPGLL